LILGDNLTTEVDELATRAANDQTLAGPGMEQTIKSVIETMRQQWNSTCDKHFPLYVPIAVLTRDGQAVYEENCHCRGALMSVVQAEKPTRR